MMISSPKKQQGAVLIVVLLLLMIMMVLAVSLSGTSSTHAKIANNSVLKTQAFQIAESGSDVILSYLVKDSRVALDALKMKTCDKKFEEQFQLAGADGTNNNSITTASDASLKRKYEISWYACFPQGETEKDCDGGKCFAVVISGKACAVNGSTVDTKSCVVSRHLQGYRIGGSY